MTWINPVPNAVQSRGFGPSPYYFDNPMYASGDGWRAHDVGNGTFPGAVYQAHYHAALDLAAPASTPIYAPQAGTVLDAKFGYPGSWANGGGWFFRVQVNPSCMYLGAHCSQLYVQAGQRVAKGQLIARVGLTGLATGNHCHFWVRLGSYLYYDPNAFYYNPRLVLPGGALYGDRRFEPPGAAPQPPAPTPTPTLADGDPYPMRMRSLMLPDGKVPSYRLLAGKPIRKDATVNGGVWLTVPAETRIYPPSLIDKDDLPAAERKYGDVLVVLVYKTNGYHFGYVKAVDIA